MDFEYITLNLPGVGVSLENFEQNLIGCECKNNDCTIQSNCSCLKMSGNLVSNYNVDGEILHTLSSNHPIFECSQNCICSSKTCKNRIVSNGICHKIEIFNTDNNLKGYGVRALENIPKGKFIAEYIGEVITRDEAYLRFKYANKHNYIFTLNEYFSGNLHTTYIDARKKANIARFINHSCSPNLYPQIIRSGALTPRLAFFAIRDILSGEELCYDYGEQFIFNKQKNDISFTQKVEENSNFKNCFCGAINCRKFLPSIVDKFL